MFLEEGTAYTTNFILLFDVNCYVSKVYHVKIKPCIGNNFNLNWVDDLWKLDERFSAEWAGVPCCLHNLCEKLVRMVRFYGAVLLGASLQKQFPPKPPSVLPARAYAISSSLKVNWFITPGKCIDWKERSPAAVWHDLVGIAWDGPRDRGAQGTWAASWVSDPPLTAIEMENQSAPLCELNAPLCGRKGPVSVAFRSHS